MVKSLPTVRKTWVPSLGQEDLLQKEMATHSSILAWKIQWTEDPDRLQCMGSQRVRHDWVTSFFSTGYTLATTASASRIYRFIRQDKCQHKTAPCVHLILSFLFNCKCKRKKDYILQLNFLNDLGILGGLLIFSTLMSPLRTNMLKIKIILSRWSFDCK